MADRRRRADMEDRREADRPMEEAAVDMEVSSTQTQAHMIRRGPCGSIRGGSLRLASGASCPFGICSSLALCASRCVMLSLHCVLLV